MRLMGIDYGSRKIGLALGDTQSGVAVPIETILCTPHVFTHLKTLVEVEQIGALVVGVPLSAGAFHSNTQLESVRLFIKKLQEEVDVPIFEVDERYTSTESQRLRKEQGTRVSEDSLAAMLILQSYLDGLR